MNPVGVPTGRVLAQLAFLPAVFTDRGSPDTGSDLRLFVDYMSAMAVGALLLSPVWVVL